MAVHGRAPLTPPPRWHRIRSHYMDLSTQPRPNAPVTGVVCSGTLNLALGLALSLALGLLSKGALVI